MDSVIGGVLTNLVSEFIVVVFGVLFAQFVKSKWDAWRYGQWQVIVEEVDGTRHERTISPRKAKEILEASEDLSVFLKGVVSPYGHINCDLVSEGRENGLLEEDHTNRRFVIHLDKNPSPATSKGARTDGERAGAPDVL